MACICVNEPKRFLSCGSCFHDTDDLPLRLATGVFNLVCALHAAADVSEVESDRGLRDCLVTIVERLFILSARHPPPGNTREKKSGRQSVAENPLARAEDRMACNDHFTLLKRFSATLLAVGDARSGHGQSRPSPDAGEWRRAAGPNGMGPNVHTVEESGRCQHLSSLGTDFCAVHEVGKLSPFSEVESTPLPTTREPGTSGVIPANLEDRPAVTGCHANLPSGPGLGVERASWNSLRESTTRH